MELSPILTKYDLGSSNPSKLENGKAYLFIKTMKLKFDIIVQLDHKEKLKGRLKDRERRRENLGGG